MSRFNSYTPPPIIPTYKPKIVSKFPPNREIKDSEKTRLVLMDKLSVFSRQSLFTLDNTEKYNDKPTLKATKVSGGQMPYGYISMSPVKDLSKSDYFEIVMKIDNPDVIASSFQLRFISETGNYIMSLQKEIQVVKTAEGSEWRRIRVNIKDATTTNTPDWKAIKELYFYFSSNSDQPFNVWVAEVNAIKVSKATLYIDFDDAKTPVYTYALPIMQKYNLKGTLYVITERVNTVGNAMTWKQIQEAALSGWTIGSHTHTHRNLETLTREEIIYEYSESQRILQEQGFVEGSYFLATPQGGWSTVAREEAKKRFIMARNIWSSGPEFDTFPENDMHGVRYVSVYNRDSVESIKAVIDRLIATKGSHHLTFHVFSEDGLDSEISYPAAGFDEICAYIASKRNAGLLDVLTAEEGYLQHKGQLMTSVGKHFVNTVDSEGNPILLKLNRD